MPFGNNPYEMLYQWKECIANRINTIAPKLREDLKNKSVEDLELIIKEYESAPLIHKIKRQFFYSLCIGENLKYEIAKEYLEKGSKEVENG